MTSAVFLGLALAAFLPAAVVEKDIGGLIDGYITSFPPHERFNGVVLVAEGDHILFQKGYGPADIAFGAPVTDHTGFEIGSISKAFASMIALRLAEQGLVDMDKTISEYLPYFPAANGSRITLRQLLSNTSGIPHHYQIVPDYFRSHDHYFHYPRELLRLFWDTPLAHEPGADFTYSSPGFYIAGAILEQAAKKSYGELLQELICGPLGMKETYVENDSFPNRPKAEGYLRGLSGLAKAYDEDKSTALAAGDIVSTAYDLFLWQQALSLKEDKVLGAKSKELMFRPVLEGRFITMTGPHYEIPYDNGSKKLAVSVLNGTSSGYSCCLNRQTEMDRCVIVLSNVNGEDVTRIADDIGDIILRNRYGIGIGEEAPLTRRPPTTATPSETEARRIAGIYRSGPGSYLAVIARDGKCFSLDFRIDSGVGTVMELRPKSGSDFFMGHNTSFSCRFSEERNGLSSRLEARRGERAFQRGERVSSRPDVPPEFQGYYASVETQKTYHFRVSPEGLIAEDFLSGKDVPLVFLEEDLFGGETTGFLRFRRDPDGSVQGFDLFREDVDRNFGSRFVLIAD